MYQVKRVDEVNGLMTIAAVCRVLGLSKSQVRYRVLKAGLTVTRVGNSDLVSLDAVKRALEVEERCDE